MINKMSSHSLSQVLAHILLDGVTQTVWLINLCVDIPSLINAVGEVASDSTGRQLQALFDASEQPQDRWAALFRIQLDQFNVAEF